MDENKLSSSKQHYLGTPLGQGWREEYAGGSRKAEEALIQKWADDFKEVQRLPQRPLHNLSRAAMSNAEFRVANDIPELLRVGFLKPGHTYRATARFSNAGKEDNKPDLHGLALRVHLENHSVQDFLMTSAAAANYRDPGQFAALLKAMALGKFEDLLFSVGLVEAARMLFVGLLQTHKHVDSLATEAYWSRAPFAFGRTALKYAIFPAACRAVSPAPKGKDRLRQDFFERLKHGPMFFDFKVQLYVDDKLTPIEDVSIEWKEKDSPFIKIGELYIPQQDLNTPEALVIEKLINAEAFSPWHTIGEITPIGIANRARKAVYDQSAQRRHGLEPGKEA